jgi:predicted DNA binding CopG/RHH family protein
MIKNRTYKLDQEEQEILDAFDKGELKSSLKDPKELETVIMAAKSTLKRNKKVNVKVSEVDLMKIKAKAHENGIPYQTLIGAVLHQYANGKLTASI